MKLPREAVKQLQAAWHESYGEPLSDEEAEAMGNNIIQTYDVLIALSLKRPHEHV